MHEVMIHELCMCIEMHTCEVMHVGELRNGNSHVIIVKWRWCSTLVAPLTFGILQEWDFIELENGI